MAKAAQGLEIAEITNFSGGTNFRDSATELTPTEAYSAWNCTFDERGGVSSRLGHIKRNGSTLGSAKVTNEFYSNVLSGFVTQVGTGLYFADNTTVRHTFSTSGICTFAELAGKVIVGHPADGLFYSTDGITWTQITSTNAPTTANCICTWNAKLFVGMSDGGVHWSNASDPLTWTSTDFNEFWTKDQKPIVAMWIGSGQDIQGRPGLLVFKEDSVYRMNDSGTGAYTVLDTSHGAAGPKAVVGVGSRVLWIGKGGIFWFREDQASPVAAADLMRPFWRPEDLSFANQSGWCAGRRLNRAFFSFSSAGSGVNDVAVEFHPDEGWVAPRSDAMTCYSTDANSNTYGGSTTANGQMYQLDSGGSDDGTAISWYFQIRWLVPNNGFQAQFWQARIHGRGTGTMLVRSNYQDSGGTAYSFNLSSPGPQWGSFSWGDGSDWTAALLSQTEAFYGMGAVRQFSLRFSGTSSTTSTGRTLVGNLTAPQLGAFGLYGIECIYTPLGLS